MKLLTFEEIKNTIFDLASDCNNDVNIITAFCKIEMLKELDSLIARGVKKRLLVRFLPSDLVNSTDREIYDYCKKNGWELYIDYDMHAKVFIFDKYKCVIGSANLTNKGLLASDNSNKEASVFYEMSVDDYQKILSLYNDSILLDDELYTTIINEVNNESAICQIKRKFSLENKPINCLMPEDFPIGDEDIIDLHKFKSYKWLINFLQGKESNFSYFGEISSKIHDIFVKDPRPFRKDIKDYLTSLLTCIKNNQDPNIQITRPNYSEKVSLKKL